MNIIQLSSVLLMTTFLGACATTGASTVKPASIASTQKIVSTSSPVVQVAGPYDAAKTCVSGIPGINQLNIAVGPIADNTGKSSMNEGGNGSFVSQGTTDFFFNTLYGLGVSVTDMTPAQQADVAFIASAGVQGQMRTPTFIIRGSVTALDLAQQSNVAELALFGFGPKTRAFNALGRMDVRLVTLPDVNVKGNILVASSSVAKQFLAVETDAGFASFVGNAEGLTYASFRLGGSVREPMQHTMSFMVDYAASDLVLKLLMDKGTSAQKAAATNCRQLLENPGHTV